MIRLIMIVLTVVLFAQNKCHAQAAQIVVPVTLYYQGNSITINMAVDTGATITTIDNSVADLLGVRTASGSGLAQMADGRSVRYQTAVMDVRASTMKRDGLEVNIMDYSANRQAQGMLGLNFLENMTMTIDWRNHRIYWSE